MPKSVTVPLRGWDRLVGYLPKLLVQLLLCRFCLSYHTAFWLYVLGWVPTLYWASYDCQTMAALWLAPVVALAIVGVGQLLPLFSSNPTVPVFSVTAAPAAVRSPFDSPWVSDINKHD